MSELEALLKKRGWSAGAPGETPQPPKGRAIYFRGDQKPTVSQFAKKEKAKLRQKTKLDDLITKRNGKRKHGSTFEDELGQKHSTRSAAMTEAERDQMERSLTKKAKLYDDLQKGYAADSAGVYNVDFDRKYAEAIERGEDPVESHDEKDAGEKDMNYIDQFGRTIKMTKKQYRRQLKMDEDKAKFREEFSARPSLPSKVIRGDYIQYEAFQADDTLNEKLDKARELNKKIAENPNSHFDKTEVSSDPFLSIFERSSYLPIPQAQPRRYGAGFMELSHDDEERRKQMVELEAIHQEVVKMRTDLKKKQEEANDAPEDSQNPTDNVSDALEASENPTNEATEDSNAPFTVVQNQADTQEASNGKGSAVPHPEDPFAILERQVREKEAEAKRKADEFLEQLARQLGR